MSSEGLRPALVEIFHCAVSRNLDGCRGKGAGAARSRHTCQQVQLIQYPNTVRFEVYRHARDGLRVRFITG